MDCGEVLGTDKVGPSWREWIVGGYVLFPAPSCLCSLFSGCYKGITLPLPEAPTTMILCLIAAHKPQHQVIAHRNLPTTSQNNPFFLLSYFPPLRNSVTETESWLMWEMRELIQIAPTGFSLVPKRCVGKSCYICFPKVHEAKERKTWVSSQLTLDRSHWNFVQVLAHQNPH